MKAFEWPAWGDVLVPDVALAESFLRASAVYLTLVVLFRVVLKRQTGSLGLPDVLLVVLVSEAASQAITAQANSVPNGLVAVLALLFWSYALDRLADRWPWFRRRLEPAPVELVRDGRPVRENLTAEGVSDDDLAAQLRRQGVDDVRRVRRAVMEAEGTVSVVRADDGGPPAPAAPGPPAEPPGPPDAEALTREFLAAAARLREAVGWHERRAAGHRHAAEAARKVLRRYGVRPRTLEESPHADPDRAEGPDARPVPAEAGAGLRHGPQAAVPGPPV